MLANETRSAESEADRYRHAHDVAAARYMKRFGDMVARAASPRASIFFNGPRVKQSMRGSAVSNAERNRIAAQRRVGLHVFSEERAGSRRKFPLPITWKSMTARFPQKSWADFGGIKRVCSRSEYEVSQAIAHGSAAAALAISCIRAAHWTRLRMS